MKSILPAIWLLAASLALGAEPSTAPPRPPAPAPVGTFIAVGYGGRRVSSRDGLTWTNDQRWSDKEAEDDDVLLDIAFGLGRFIAVGGGPTRGRLQTTRDGEQWISLPEVQGRVGTIAFGNGRFVAGHGAELLFSNDGERFTTGPQLDWPGTICPKRSASGDTEAGFRFVLIGDADLRAEQKRVSWRAVTGDGTSFLHTALETPPARDIAYGAGHFVVVGPGGLIESSHDGQTWRRHQVGVTDGFNRVLWTGSRFLIGGGKLAWSSPDGLTWQAEAKAIPCTLGWAKEGWIRLGFSWGGNLYAASTLADWKAIYLPPGPSLTAIAFGPAGE